MHGFGFAEMPPIIYGGKEEIKCNPLISCGVNNHWNVTEIEDFEVNCKPSGDLHGFGFAEMPPIIYGGKDEIKCNPLISCGVNNHWNTRNYRFRFLLKIKNYFTQI